MIKLFKKDLLLFFKDIRSVLLTFLLPIILISLFAFAFGGVGGGENTSQPIQLLVVDLDQTESSKLIISDLDSLTGLNVTLSELEESKSLIQKGKYPAALVFYTGFEKAMNNGADLPTELFYDKSREMEVGMLQPVLIRALITSTSKKTISNKINKYLYQTFPDLDSEISERILNDASGNSDDNSSFNFESSIKTTSIVGEVKDSNLGLIQAVAGTAILMLLFSVAGLGTSILEEKENGTIKRLLYSPIKGSTILYGKMLFTFIIAIFQLIVMFVFSWLVLGLDLFMDLPSLILMIIATAFAVSSFGIFLAAVSKTRQQAQSLSTLIILIMSAIGGSMIPLFIMPAIMQKIAVFSVNYWGIQGFYDIFWRGLSLVEVLPRIFVLIGIGIIMTFLSIHLFKRNVLKLV